jgi:hypothetical protein
VAAGAEHGDEDSGIEGDLVAELANWDVTPAQSTNIFFAAAACRSKPCLMVRMGSLSCGNSRGSTVCIKFLGRHGCMGR